MIGTSDLLPLLDGNLGMGLGLVWCVLGIRRALVMCTWVELMSVVVAKMHGEMKDEWVGR